MGLVFEHSSVEPLVIQKLDTRAILLVSLKDVDVERIYATLQSVEICLVHSVTVCVMLPHPSSCPWLSN